MNTLAKTSVLISLVVAGLFFRACNHPQNNSSDMEDHQHSSVYTCPMHSEITGKKGNKCPECGMDLVAVSDENSTKVKVKLITEPQAIEAGTPIQLTFTFEENDKKVPLDISHEMKVHLMVVNEDLTWFRHIHPEEQADGSYTLSENFPNGGKYFLFTNFKPQGAASTVDKKEISVKGNPDNSKADFSIKRVSIVDGYTVTIENGNDLKTGRIQPLEISVEKDDKKLSENDIEPYLGATAHIVMISKADKDFLHIHPLSDKRFPIYAQTHIEKPGIYRIWVEFQTNGKVHTADFTVNVAEGKQTGNEEHQEHNEHHH